MRAVARGVGWGVMRGVIDPVEWRRGRTSWKLRSNAGMDIGGFTTVHLLI